MRTVMGGPTCKKCGKIMVWGAKGWECPKCKPQKEQK